MLPGRSNVKSFLQIRKSATCKIVSGLGGRLNYTSDGGLVGPEGSVARLRRGNAVHDMPLGAVRLWNDKVLVDAQHDAISMCQNETAIHKITVMAKGSICRMTAES